MSHHLDGKIPFRGAPRPPFLWHRFHQAPVATTNVRTRKKPKCGWEVLIQGVPQNGWFIMENPIKMDDLGAPPFLETPIQQSFRQVFITTMESITGSWCIVDESLAQQLKTYRDLPKGAKLFLKGFNSPSLGVSLAPLGRCGALDSPRSMGS